MTLRAKFLCNKIEDYGTWKKVFLMAQYSNTKEDNQFSSATPSGSMEMTVTSESGMGYFKPGKQYYLDITEATN